MRRYICKQLFHCICILLIIALSFGNSQYAEASEIVFSDVLDTIPYYPEEPMTSRYLEPFQSVLLLGETVQMQYVGNQPTDEDLYFESLDTNIATVDQRGLVCGVGMGSTTIAIRSKEKYYAAGFVAVYDAYPKGLLHMSIIPSPFDKSVDQRYCVDWDLTNKQVGWGASFPAITVSDDKIPTGTEEFDLVAWIRAYNENGEMIVRYISNYYGLCNLNVALAACGSDIWERAWPEKPSYVTVSIEPMLIDWYPLAYKFVYLPGEHASFTITVVPPTVPHYFVDVSEEGKIYSPGDTIEFTFHSLAPDLVKEPIQCLIKDCDGRFKDVLGGYFDSKTESVTVPVTFTKDMIGYWDDSSNGCVYLECYIGDMLITSDSIDFGRD